MVEEKKNKKVNKMTVAEAFEAIKKCREQGDSTSDRYRLLLERTREGKNPVEMPVAEAMVAMQSFEEIGDTSSAYYKALRFRLIRQ